MKTVLCTLCLLCATAAFAQTGAAVLANNPQPIVMNDHPERAFQHPMAQETSLLEGSLYTYAKGEVPLSELGFIEYETPLGDVARALKKERAAKATKPVKVMDN